MYITWDRVEVWTGETPVSLGVTPFHMLFYWQDTSLFSKMEWSSKELFCGAILPFSEVKVTGDTGQGGLGFLDFHRGLWRSSGKQLEPSGTLCTLNVIPNVFSSLFQLVTWGQNLVSVLTCRHYQLLSLPQSRDEGHLIFGPSLKIEAAVGSARVKPAFLLQSALCRVRLAQCDVATGWRMYSGVCGVFRGWWNGLRSGAVVSVREADTLWLSILLLFFFLTASS